jgi:hypothetical protein
VRMFRATFVFLKCSGDLPSFRECDCSGHFLKIDCCVSGVFLKAFFGVGEG